MQLCYQFIGNQPLKTQIYCTNSVTNYVSDHQLSLHVILLLQILNKLYTYLYKSKKGVSMQRKIQTCFSFHEQIKVCNSIVIKIQFNDTFE